MIRTNTSVIYPGAASLESVIPCLSGIENWMNKLIVNKAINPLYIA